MSQTGGILITGASTGIGQACALHLHARGYHVFAGVRKPADGEHLQAQASERLEWLILDVTDEDQIAEAAAWVSTAVGERGLAGLVNNAGIAVGGPLEYLPANDLRRQLEVNVIGLHAVTAAFLPLVRRGRGRIVHIGSISGRLASPLIGAYSASKHAVEALTDVLRLELAPEGIHVAVVEPGQVRTPIWEKGLSALGTFASRLPPEGVARYGGRLKVLQRLLERAPLHSSPPEAVARVVSHALEAVRPRTRYVVGRDARLRLWLSHLLTDRAMDALILAMFRKVERRLA
jgi:NAD(P)-dependent dehydrogenase (short-subunit alcohol dehydrogenase family)